MKAQKKQRKNKKFTVTEDILKQLQESLNDTIKPDFKEKRDGKKGKKPKKEQSSNGSSERSKSETTV